MTAQTVISYSFICSLYHTSELCDSNDSLHDLLKNVDFASLFMGFIWSIDSLFPGWYFCVVWFGSESWEMLQILSRVGLWSLFHLLILHWIFNINLSQKQNYISTCRKWGAETTQRRKHILFLWTIFTSQTVIPLSKLKIGKRKCTLQAHHGSVGILNIFNVLIFLPLGWWCCVWQIAMANPETFLL